jgi:hypothetical protein
VKNIFYEDLISWNTAVQTYNISKLSISRIFNTKRKRKSEKEKSEKKPWKRGHQSSITIEMLAYILGIRKKILNLL